MHFEVLHRQGVPESAVQPASCWYTRHGLALGDVSSTKARNAGEKSELDALVTPSVSCFFVDNRLYSFRTFPVFSKHALKHIAEQSRKA